MEAVERFSTGCALWLTNGIKRAVLWGSNRTEKVSQREREKKKKMTQRHERLASGTT